jgi:hypothetical protein
MNDKCSPARKPLHRPWPFGAAHEVEADAGREDKKKKRIDTARRTGSAIRW